MSTYDAERLYTFIQQPDLATRLKNFFGDIFARHVDTPVVAISSRGTAKWREGELPPQRFINGEGCRHYLMDLASVHQLIDLIIDNVFVTVGDRIYRQCRGMPMGVNPAVYFANLYLFTYEWDFVHRLITVHAAPHTAPAQRVLALKALRAFQWVARYIDDLLIITSAGISMEFVSLFLYVEQPHQGLTGIYPPSLTLSSTSQPVGMTAKYMDVYLCLAFQHHGPIVTKLYDKRREPEFHSRIAAIRLQHMSTCLSSTCKWNIFDGQFVRLTRIISDVGNFVDEVVILITDLRRMGYPLTGLLVRLRRRINTTPILYGVARGTTLPTANTMHRPRGLYRVIADRVVQFE